MSDLFLTSALDLFNLIIKKWIRIQVMKIEKIFCLFKQKEHFKINFLLFCCFF